MTEILKINKAVRTSPRLVYDVEDLRGRHIEGKFYTEKLTPVHIMKETAYR